MGGARRLSSLSIWIGGGVDGAVWQAYGRPARRGKRARESWRAGWRDWGSARPKWRRETSGGGETTATAVPLFGRQRKKKTVLQLPKSLGV